MAAHLNNQWPLALKVEACVAALFFAFIGWGVYEGLRLDQLDHVSAGGLALTAMAIQTVGFVAVGQYWYRSTFAAAISAIFISGSLLAIYHVEREYYLIKMLADKATNAVALNRIDAYGARLRDAEGRVRLVTLYTDNVQEVYQQTRRLAEGEAQGSATGKVGRGKVYLAINQIASNAKGSQETASTMKGRMQKDLDEAKKLYADTRSALVEGRISHSAAYAALGNADAGLSGVFGTTPEVFLPKLAAVREGLKSLLTDAPSLAVSIQAIQQAEASATAALKPLSSAASAMVDMRQPLPAEAVRARLEAGDFSAQNWQVTFLLMAVPIGILLFSALHNQDGIRHFWRHGRLNEKIEGIQRKADFDKAKALAENGGNAERFFTSAQLQAPPPAPTPEPDLARNEPARDASAQPQGPTLRQRLNAFWTTFRKERAARKAKREAAPATTPAPAPAAEAPATASPPADQGSSPAPAAADAAPADTPAPTSLQDAEINALALRMHAELDFLLTAENTREMMMIVVRNNGLPDEHLQMLEKLNEQVAEEQLQITRRTFFQQYPGLKDYLLQVLEPELRKGL